MARPLPRSPIHQSTLRPFQVRLVTVEYDGFMYENVLEVTCGWCRTTFIVLDPDQWFASKRRWLNKTSNRQYHGRSCTYCYKTGRLPLEDPRGE